MLLSFVLGLLGGVLLVTGLWLFSPALALVVSGVLLLAAGLGREVTS